MGNKEMSSKENMKNILSSKNVRKHFSWLLLAFFLMDSWWIMDAFVVYFSGRPVHVFFHVVFMILAIILGMLVFIIFFRKAAGIRITVQSAFFALIGGLLINAIVSFFMRSWGRNIPRAVITGSIGEATAGFLYFGLVLLAVAITVFLSFYILTYLLNQIPLQKTGRLLVWQVGCCLQRGFVFLLVVLGTILTFCIIFSLVNYGQGLLSTRLSDGFFERYFMTMLTSTVKASFIFLLILCNNFIIKGKEESVRKLAEEEKGNLIFPIIFTVACLILSVLPLLDYKTGPEYLIEEINSRITRFDELRLAGHGMEAAAEYERARVDLLALKGLVTGIEELGGEEKRHDICEAEYFLVEAEHGYVISPYASYFQGLLRKETNLDEEADPGVHDYFVAASWQGDKVPEAHIWALNGFKTAQNDGKIKDSLNYLISQGIFTDKFSQELNIEEKKLEFLKKKIAELEKNLQDREILITLEKAKYEDTDRVVEDILNNTPEENDPNVLYQAALLADTIPYQDAMYYFAKQYYENVRNSTDSKREIEGTLFVSYMYVRSGHYDEAVKLMEEMYQKYPDNRDISCDYAYTLLENKMPEQSVAVLDSLEGEKAPLQLYLKAIGCMELEKYEEALSVMEDICERITLKELSSGELLKLEDYLYGFILEYNYIMNNYFFETGEQFLAVVRNREKGIVYHFIMGMEAWSAGDFEGSNSHYEKILEYNPNLTYPYYLMGVNYNEMAGYLKKNCYPDAERCFLRFIERRPDVAEAYFCLGFVYQHSGDMEKAERAFNRVILLNPNKDNPEREEFGMLYHAQKEMYDR